MSLIEELDKALAWRSDNVYSTRWLVLTQEQKEEILRADGERGPYNGYTRTTSGGDVYYAGIQMHVTTRDDDVLVANNILDIRNPVDETDQWCFYAGAPLPLFRQRELGLIR